MGAHYNCSSQMSPDHHSSNSIAGRFFGLSVAIAPASSYISPPPPRVWESEGEETREVMFPREGSPPAKLLCSETTGEKCFSRLLSTDARASPERLVPGPSTCTCHRRLIANAGGTGGVQTGLPQALLVRGAAHTQGLGRQDGGAPLHLPEVPANTVDRTPPSPISLAGCPAVSTDKVSRGEPPSTVYGFRRPGKSGAFRAPEDPIHSDRDALGEGGTAKTPPRTLVDSGVALGMSLANPTPVARTSMLSRTDSSTSSLQPMHDHVPLGYELYIKNTEGEQPTWKTRRTSRTSRPSKRTERDRHGFAGDCQKEANIAPKSTLPPRADPGRSKFLDIIKKHFPPARPYQIRALGAQVAKHDEKQCHSQGFE